MLSTEGSNIKLTQVTIMIQEILKFIAWLTTYPMRSLKKIYKSHYTSVYYDSHNLGFVVQAYLGLGQGSEWQYCWFTG